MNMRAEKTIRRETYCVLFSQFPSRCLSVFLVVRNDIVEQLIIRTEHICRAKTSQFLENIIIH